MVGDPGSTPLRFRSPALEIDASLVPWDTLLLGFPVGQIDAIKTYPGPEATLAFREFEAWRDARELRLVSCRLAHDRLTDSMLLEDYGFRFVELVYPLHYQLSTDLAGDANGVTIADVTPDDVAALEEIAHYAFATGRINMDPRLGPTLGGRRYAGWVRNSLADPHHQVLKALCDNRIVAFFVVEPRANTVYWHLTAVSPSMQGMGFGRRTWRAMLMRHRTDGMTRVETMISGRNTAVINLYASLGFRFDAPQMTLHWVRG